MKRKEQKTRDSSILEVGQVRRQHTLGVLRITRHEEPFRDLESPGEPPFPTLPGPLESDAKAGPESSLAQVTASPPPPPPPQSPSGSSSTESLQRIAFLFLFDRKPFRTAPFAERKRLVDLCRSVETQPREPRRREKEVSPRAFSET